MTTSDSFTAEVKKYSAWHIVTGVLTVLLGLFLIIYPFAAATVTTVLLGWVLIFVALAQVIFAFNSPTIGNFALKILLGVLYGITGAVLVFFPISGVVTLTGILGILLLMRAIFEAVTAFQVRPLQGWGWLLFDGAVTLLLAVMILSKWPSSSVWAIGTLLGVSVLMSGTSKIMLAVAIRSGAKGLESFAH